MKFILTITLILFTTLPALAGRIDANYIGVTPGAASSGQKEGDLIYTDATNLLKLWNGSSLETMCSANNTVTFTNKTFDADGTGNSITNIENADIKAAAAIARNKLAAVTASRAMVSDSSGFDDVSATTATELGYVSGVTSAIQTQINAKAPSASPTFTGVSLNASGSAAAPSIAFTSDASNDSGLYLIGANSVGISAAGSLNAQFDAFGAYFRDGGAGGAGISFTADTNTGLKRLGADNLGLITGGNTTMDVDNDSINMQFPVLLKSYATGSLPSGVTGFLAYDSTLNRIVYYNGSAWTTNTDLTRECSADITSSGGVPSISAETSNDGTDCFSTITDTATGRSVLNLNASVYSAAPHCTCTSQEDVTSSVVCAITGTSTSSISEIRTRSSTLGTLTDESYYIICHGNK